jgi:hypothetical protein
MCLLYSFHIFSCRAKLDNEAKEVINESLILQPITFGLLMLRNLSAGWYKEMPDIELRGGLQSINVSTVKLSLTFLKKIQQARRIK